MKISEVMTRNVRTVSPDHTAKDAASFMLSEDAGSMPVSDGDKLIGMITDRDIAVRGVAKGHGPDTLVRDIMTDEILCAREDEDIDAVVARMSDAQVRRIPVIDASEKLCGIVSLGDLSREADRKSADEALQGVSAPGNRHKQG